VPGLRARGDTQARQRAYWSCRLNRLALRSDGTVWAWGGGDNGQLGDGTLAGHTTPEEPLPVPAGLHGVLSAGLDALPADARDALLVASCLRSPTTTMLEQASGSSVVDSLRMAAFHGVVEFEGARVRFTHPLLASAIHSSAPSVWRREAHRRLGSRWRSWQTIRA